MTAELKLLEECGICKRRRDGINVFWYLTFPDGKTRPVHPDHAGVEVEAFRQTKEFARKG